MGGLLRLKRDKDPALARTLRLDEGLLRPQTVPPVPKAEPKTGPEFQQVT